jgi:hypothetical protein
MRLKSFDPGDYRNQSRGRFTDRTNNNALITVPTKYLFEPSMNINRLPSRTRGYIAVSEYIGSETVVRREFAHQFIGESTVTCLDHGTGVMSDEGAEARLGVVGGEQVSGAVEGVKAGQCEFWRVSDVVEVGCADQQRGVVANQICDSFGGAADSFAMVPPRRQRFREQAAGKVSRPGDGVHSRSLDKLSIIVAGRSDPFRERYPLGRPPPAL